ncbi:uncharacterized protein LOC116198039 isoform X2 [Punica granatum]|uniref:Uncharacterized protein LOC116198039 isoform X2 n=1 Tax=Punica granatum TaxID=22663 RepID=A0A6P8CLC0_PUNGR|nr:uncharacterized protein LOC116198039 isoform X2 [Punica granatum]
MVGWHRHLQSVIGYVGRRRVGTAASFDAFRSFTGSSASLFGAAEVRSDPLGSLQRLWRHCPSSSVAVPRSFYQHQQLNWISTSRKLLASSSDGAPVSSPLTPSLITSGRATEAQKSVSKPAKVQAVLKGIKQVIHSARANATHNHGLDADRLLVAEAFVGKGLYKKRMNPHSKGRCGIKMRPVSRLTVVVREITPEEEAEIAKLRVSNFKKLTKRERRLVPHKLIETTPIWNRKSKNSSIRESDAVPA